MCCFSERLDFCLNSKFNQNTKRCIFFLLVMVSSHADSLGIIFVQVLRYLYPKITADAIRQCR